MKSIELIKEVAPEQAQVHFCSPCRHRGEKMKSKTATLSVLLLLLIPFAAAVTLQDADEAFTSAALDVRQMKSAGLPVDSLEDALDAMSDKLHGENISLLMDKIAILNASNESDKMVLASQLSSLVQASLSSGLPVGANYSFVVEKAVWIRGMKEKAFASAELLSDLQKSIASINVTVNLSRVIETLGSAEMAFSDERYNDVPPLVEQAKSQLEDAQVESARERAFLRLARRNVVDYTKDHWRGLLIALASVVIVGFWIFFESRTLYALRKIRLLSIELSAVEQTERSTQEQYYSCKMGATTYKSRMSAFKQKQRKLRTDLQVWHGLAKSYRRFAVFSRFG
ncbi:Uncharacterised protein [uncultured archaeon]|nr:Uncharacterised protein [uncultured archaeon]